LSEKHPSQVRMAKIAHVSPHTMRTSIILLLKMAIDQGYEIVRPIPLGMYREVKNGNRIQR